MGRRTKDSILTEIGDFTLVKDTYENNQKKLDNGCIEWTGAKHRQGYGFVAVILKSTGKRRMMTAHRIAAMIKENREIPSNEMVLHTCDNMGCCNPDHLLINGTTADRAKFMKKYGKTTKGRKLRPVGIVIEEKK